MLADLDRLGHQRLLLVEYQGEAPLTFAASLSVIGWQETTKNGCVFVLETEQYAA